jgi:hypothetical protein
VPLVILFWGEIVLLSTDESWPIVLVKSPLKDPLNEPVAKRPLMLS